MCQVMDKVWLGSGYCFMTGKWGVGKGAVHYTTVFIAALYAKISKMQYSAEKLKKVKCSEVQCNRVQYSAVQ